MVASEIRLTDPRALRGYAHPLRMALVGLLRVQGPMTATQAAEQLGESVPSCSFHLRQLAKYGLAERVEGADARERPWRATARVTSWDSGSDDPAVQAATDQLNTTILDHYLRRAQAYLARRSAEPARWRDVTGFGDSLVYVTPDELATLRRRIDELLAEFDDRATDPAARPADARGIGFIQLVLPYSSPTHQPGPTHHAQDRPDR
ncbi:helix-turn-helix domain-containing protein [Solwaraspora sp. WMMD1047]|uniref:winged helix-turn-helix domain-containing protein n=1 Tax=Solwaraspora sp. WMMD1047 TaxID=3016102 RepID=UPI002416F967|nr:helix-turn-helix domain-containing protein [Solwaraspora sp. WMMD1047]MDG4831794.1 helix-turn-helix domain-containing protein [Solwaraspora sp. WMMD1047]